MPTIIEAAGNGSVYRKGSFRSAATLTEKGTQRTASFEVIVMGDNYTQTDLDILTTATTAISGDPMPLIGDLIAGMYVVNIEFSREPDDCKKAFKWIASYSLDSEIDLNNLPRNSDGSLDQSGGPGNPIYLPADFDVDSEIEYIPLDRPEKDADGEEFVNRFGQPIGRYVTGFEAERAINVIRIQRWGVWPTPLSQLNFYNNTCNSDVFHTVPIGCAWLSVKSKKAWHDGIAYARESYVIRILIDPEDPTRQNTWGELKVPHYADRFLETANDETTVKKFDDFGNPGPFLIRDDGTLVEAGQPTEYLTFKPKRSVPFGPLNLPNS